MGLHLWLDTPERLIGRTIERGWFSVNLGRLHLAIVSGIDEERVLKQALQKLQLHVPDRPEDAATPEALVVSLMGDPDLKALFELWTLDGAPGVLARLGRIALLLSQHKPEPERQHLEAIAATLYRTKLQIQNQTQEKEI